MLPFSMSQVELSKPRSYFKKEKQLKKIVPGKCLNKSLHNRL